MLKFFKIVDNDIEINKEELYLIPSARKLVAADKGGLIHGDYDGRRKLMAIKKLGLVWWVVDVNSPSVQAGFEGDALMEDAILSLSIPKEWDWKTDIEFKNFLEDYTAMYSKASYARILKEILIAFDDSAELVRVIRTQVREKLDDKIDLDADDITMLMTSMNQIIKVAGEVPSHIKKVKELQIIVAKEEKDITLARGDKKVTSSMRPNE